MLFYFTAIPDDEGIIYYGNMSKDKETWGIGLLVSPGVEETQQFSFSIMIEPNSRCTYPTEDSPIFAEFCDTLAEAVNHVAENYKNQRNKVFFEKHIYSCYMNGDEYIYTRVKKNLSMLSCWGKTNNDKLEYLILS